MGADNKASNVELESYRACVLTVIEGFMQSGKQTGKVSAFKTLTVNSNEKDELKKLSSDLVHLWQDINVSSQQTVNIITADDSSQPSIQELIIRLLEQLLVPNELAGDVNEMKERLEHGSNSADWKILLKDVAALINAISSRMQDEKHESEDFLQTITGRLNDIDEFLQIASRSIPQE